MILWKKDRVLSRKNIRDPLDINVEYYPNPKKIIPAKEKIKPSQHVPMLPLPPTRDSGEGCLGIKQSKVIADTREEQLISVGHKPTHLLRFTLPT